MRRDGEEKKDLRERKRGWAKTRDCQDSKTQLPFLFPLSACCLINMDLATGVTLTLNFYLVDRSLEG